MSNQFKSLAAAAVLVLAGVAQASPLPLEGRTITGARVASTDASAVMEYDPNLNITWLRDWNVNGAKSWQDQMDWAESLQVGTFANWSLPTALNQDGSGPCELTDCTGSQMGYMYYVELGNPAGGPVLNTGPFQNFQLDFYWSGTEYAPEPILAWYFRTYAGTQGTAVAANAFYAVAVRPGDVAAPVPEPQTLALALLALCLTAVVRRKAI